MQTRNRTGFAQSAKRRLKLALFIPISAAMVMACPQRAQAQEPLTLGAVVAVIGAAYKAVKDGYDFWQWSKTWGVHQVTTAELIDAAVAEIKSTIINVDVKNIMAQVQTAVSDYSYATACTDST